MSMADARSGDAAMPVAAPPPSAAADVAAAAAAAHDARHYACDEARLRAFREELRARMADDVRYLRRVAIGPSAAMKMVRRSVRPSRRRRRRRREGGVGV